MVKETKEYLPEHPDETKVTVLGEHIIFVRLWYDLNPPNPCKDEDGNGVIRSFATKHIDNIRSKSELESLQEEFKQDLIPLSYFEHGSCVWSLGGHKPLGTEGDWRWDGVDYAGVWHPDEFTLESAEQLGLKKGSRERREWMEKQAENACKLYTAFANGWVFGYSIDVYEKRQTVVDGSPVIFDKPGDYRFDDQVYEDSCFGFFDLDFVKEEVTRSLGHWLEKEVTNVE